MTCQSRRPILLKTLIGRRCFWCLKKMFFGVYFGMNCKKKNLCWNSDPLTVYSIGSYGRYHEKIWIEGPFFYIIVKLLALKVKKKYSKYWCSYPGPCDSVPFVSPTRLRRYQFISRQTLLHWIDSNWGLLSHERENTMVSFFFFHKALIKKCQFCFKISRPQLCDLFGSTF